MGERERSYRRWPSSELCSFEVCVGESDLSISAERPLREVAEGALGAVRSQLESYLERDPEFGAALEPRDPLPEAPPIAREMAQAAQLCGVGPMAAVAGAIAQHVGAALLASTGQVIVENGGDVFLYTTRPRVAAVFAGQSPLTGRIGVRIAHLARPLGLCTSSGTVGPSLSMGRADAALVLADSAALADAAATALGNRVHARADIEPALQELHHTPGILGAAVVIGSDLGAWGQLDLVPIGSTDSGEPPSPPRT